MYNLNCIIVIIFTYTRAYARGYMYILIGKLREYLIRFHNWNPILRHVS